MIRYHLRVVGAVLVSLAIGSTVQAAATLSFFATSPTTTTLGGPAITVDLVLTETGTTNISQFGLAGASFRINRSGSGSLAAPVGNANFDIVQVGGADPSVTLNQTSILGIGQTTSQVVIGSLLINASSAGNGTLSVSAFGNPDDISVYTDNLGTLLNLSPGIFAGVPDFNYSITAIPEPSSAILVLAALGLGALQMRRRRSKKLAVDVDTEA